MMYDFNPDHFKDIYIGENPLQQLRFTAAEIEKRSGIANINGHLGNPTAPSLKQTDIELADYILHRSEDPINSGYADVRGHLLARKAIAIAMNKLLRLGEQPSAEDCKNDIHKAPIGADNLIGVNGGTGALNIAFQIFNDATFLVPEPYYPPWGEIANHTKERKMETFELRRQDNYLLNEEVLDKKIGEIALQSPGKPIVIVYHYPENPVGKALTKDEARLVAARFNNLCKKYPTLYLVQENLYLATTASDMGIYTPLPYLDQNAKGHTLWLDSPSKMGHAQDRGGVLGAFNPNILKRANGCLSFDTLGCSHPSLFATAYTLGHIATAVDAKADPSWDPENKEPCNYRYFLADYYQKRLKIVAEGFQKMENGLSAGLHEKVEILPGGTPKGTYYLFPSFEFLKDKPIPEEFLKPDGPAELVEKLKGKTTFKNIKDVELVLHYADLIGLQPLTIGPGTLFTKDKDTMSFRFSSIDRNIEKMESAANTFAGLAEKATGIKLGTHFRTKEELRTIYPASTFAEQVRTSQMSEYSPAYWIAA